MIQEVRKEGAGPENALEQSIWTGRVGDSQLRWTTRDIYVDNRKWLSPLVHQEFEEFESELKKDLRPGEQMMSCDYDRYFSVVSIVGTLVSLDDQYGITCGKVSLGRRFTVVNIANREAAEAAAALSWNESRRGTRKSVKLSDYFAERDILNAILSNPLIRQALRDEHAEENPKTLAEVSSFFEDNPGVIKSKEGHFSFPPDFLDRFAFDHLEDNLVSVQISLQPAVEAEHSFHSELELLLPIPKSLKKPLRLAESCQEGFIMKDAQEVGLNRITTFKFKTPT